MITQEPIPMGIPPNQSSYTHYSHLITIKNKPRPRSIGVASRCIATNKCTYLRKRHAGTPTHRNYLLCTSFSPPPRRATPTYKAPNLHPLRIKVGFLGRNPTLMRVWYLSATNHLPHRAKRNPAWTRFQHKAVPTRRGKRTAQYCRATPYSRTCRHPVASFKNCLYICHNSNSKAL